MNLNDCTNLVKINLASICSQTQRVITTCNALTIQRFRHVHLYQSKVLTDTETMNKSKLMEVARRMNALGLKERLHNSIQ